MQLLPSKQALSASDFLRKQSKYLPGPWWLTQYEPLHLIVYLSAHRAQAVLRTSYCHSPYYNVLLAEVVKITSTRLFKARGRKEKAEGRVGNERAGTSPGLGDKIKWNIKRIGLPDTKWMWLNEKAHCINYVRPLFWGKSEAEIQKERQREKERFRFLLCCPSVKSRHFSWHRGIVCIYSTFYKAME